MSTAITISLESALASPGRLAREGLSRRVEDRLRQLMRLLREAAAEPTVGRLREIRMVASHVEQEANGRSHNEHRVRALAAEVGTVVIRWVNMARGFDERGRCWMTPAGDREDPSRPVEWFRPAEVDRWLAWELVVHEGGCVVS